MIRLFASFYLILLTFVLAHQFFGVAARNTFMRDWNMYDNTNDFIGELYLLEQLHQKMTVKQFARLVAEYPEESNIPLEVIGFEQLDVPEPELQRLTKGEIYITDPEETVLYYRLVDTTKVIKLGPLGTYEPLAQINNRYQQAIFPVLALSVFLWMLVLQRKLRRLEHAANRLGEGDFTVRVSERGGHRIGGLNHSFNQMAARLERLVQGHKSLTNAVAHELRTPVSRIRFQLDMLYEEKDNKQRIEYMFGISDDITELTDLVDELLTYARFDREVPDMHMRPHSLHESLLSIVNSKGTDSSVTVIYDDSWMQEDPELQFVSFEPRHLERAIANLVKNGQKYASTEVRVSVSRTTHECRIIVDDDGPGIPEASRSEIFEPFKRLDTSRTRATGGYGLGLAIVKQIAEWHGGDVIVESSEKSGARFVFSWPLSRHGHPGH